MSTTLPLQPMTFVDFVESEAAPGIYYRVTPTGCTCKAWSFGHARDARFLCKHQMAAFAWLVAYCRICGTERVAAPGDACVGCAHVYGVQALTAVPESTAAAIAPRCVNCGCYPATAGCDLCLPCQNRPAALPDSAFDEEPEEDYDSLAPSTPEDVALSAAIEAEIRRELATGPAPDTFLARIRATPLPTPSARNAAARAAHAFEGAGTRLQGRGVDPLAF